MGELGDTFLVWFDRFRPHERNTPPLCLKGGLSNTKARTSNLARACVYLQTDVYLLITFLTVPFFPFLI